MKRIANLFATPLMLVALFGLHCSNDEADSDGDTDSETGTDSDTDTNTDSDSVTDSDTGTDPNDTDTYLDFDTDKCEGIKPNFDFTVTERLEFVTNHGIFIVRLYGDNAPVTTTNFLRYVDDGSFAGTVFHRVISGFMIQGGGFYEGGGAALTYDPIKLEIDPSLLNRTGSIAMARTSVPDSATRQFYINVDNNNWLNGDYAVFGEVDTCYEVVDSISTVDTGFNDMPFDDVVMYRVTRLGV